MSLARTLALVIPRAGRLAAPRLELEDLVRVRAPQGTDALGAYGGWPKGGVGRVESAEALSAVLNSPVMKGEGEGGEGGLRMPDPTRTFPDTVRHTSQKDKPGGQQYRSPKLRRLAYSPTRKTIDLRAAAQRSWVVRYCKELRDNDHGKL